MKSTGLSYNSYTIPAGVQVGNQFTPGVCKGPQGGAFLYIKTTTQPFQMQFDGLSIFYCEGGFKFTQNFDTATLYNPTALPIVVSIYTGATGVDYVGTNQIKDAVTYSLGNLGLKANGSYNGQTITFGSGVTANTITAPSAGGVTITDQNNGHQRQSIIISCFGVYGQNYNSVAILDQNGCYCGTVSPQSSLVFEVGGPLTIVGVGGTAYFQSFEIYYAS